MISNPLEVRQISDPMEAWMPIMDYLKDDDSDELPDADYLGVFDGTKMAGAFLVRPWNNFCYEMHGGVHPAYWGNGAEVCKTAGMSLFNGQCVKIVCQVPAYNRMMISTLKTLGLKHEGTVTKAFMKNMRLHDIEIYGITKGEAIWQQ